MQAVGLVLAILLLAFILSLIFRRPYDRRRRREDDDATFDPERGEGPYDE
jgi:hypothetical protein